VNLLNFPDQKEKLKFALSFRQDLIKNPDMTAIRLFNGFLEGLSPLTLDLFDDTLLVYDYSEAPDENHHFYEQVWKLCLELIPTIKSVILKTRNTASSEEKNGKLVFGNKSANRILEHNIHYAIDLQMNQDASFYMDTRNLRKWLIENMNGMSVLNTFAYTGSLGAAAMAAGATRVTQTDINRKFLNIAKTTYVINGYKINKNNFIVGDFFKVVNTLKRQKHLFNCVILDPPFFSSTKAGNVNLLEENHRLINKVRPLVSHNGWLIVVNNALFLSGAEFQKQLENLCLDEYMKFESVIPVPQDVTGYPETRVSNPPVESFPFNHSTKIAFLKVLRKDKNL
jgi:23S rRNA (cytosine1962-C5)-methyltransferase